MKKEEKLEGLPVAKPLKVIDYRTLSKGFGWWSAVVLAESWGKKQLIIYLWQQKRGAWARKQKFTIHDTQQWENIVETVNGLLPQLEKQNN